MKVLGQTFALFLAITPLLAAPVPVPSTDAVTETNSAPVAHHHHHHTGHHATHHEEERSLFAEEDLAERSFDEEEAILERRGSAMSSLKPKKKEEKSFEVTRRPGPKPQRQNSTGTAHSVQHVQHSGTERKGPLRVVNHKRGAAMSKLKPKKEEKSFEVTRRPGPKPERQNSTGTAHSVQHVQHSGTERKGPLRVVNQKRGAAMSKLKPKKEEKSFEVTRRPGPKPERQNSTGTAHSVQHVQHSGTERKGPLRVVNQKRGAAMSKLKPKKEEKSFEVTRRPGPKPERQNSTGTAHSVQHVQHSGTERKGPLRVVNHKRGAAMSKLKPKKEEKGFEVTRRPGPKPQRQNSTGTAHSVQHVQHSGTDRKGPLRVTNP